MRTLLVSLLYFLYTLGLAYWQQWTATDIVWTMWLASLVGGYLLILFSIFGSLGQKKGIFSPLFMLVFFTLHFVGFHLAHSIFLSDFFPLPGAPDEYSFVAVLRQTLSQYWMFLIVVVARVAPDLIRHVRDTGEPSFEEPYKSVIRNHILIFVVAFADRFLSGGQLLYVLLIFYFFPFEEVKRLLRGERAQESVDTNLFKSDGS